MNSQQVARAAGTQGLESARYCRPTASNRERQRRWIQRNGDHRAASGGPLWRKSISEAIENPGNAMASNHPARGSLKPIAEKDFPQQIKVRREKSD